MSAAVVPALLAAGVWTGLSAADRASSESAATTGFTARLNAAQEIPKPTGRPGRRAGHVHGHARPNRRRRDALLAADLPGADREGDGVPHPRRRARPRRCGAGRALRAVRSGARGFARVNAKTLTALLAGRTYVNVHTARNAAGEIRGQIAKTAKRPVPPPPPTTTDNGARRHRLRRRTKTRTGSGSPPVSAALQARYAPPRTSVASQRTKEGTMHRYLWAALARAPSRWVSSTLGLVGAAGARGGSGYEVWAVDQSNTNGHDERRRRSTSTTADSLERRGTRPALRRSGSTSAAPRRRSASRRPAPRPSGRTCSSSTPPQSHADPRVRRVRARLSSSTRDERTPLACIDVGVQAHAAVPSPDESYVVVANQNGKLLQRITTDYATNTFTLEPAATLDLANGTTPTGALRQDPGAPARQRADLPARRLDEPARVRDAARRRPLRRRQPGDADADRRRVRPGRRSTATAAAAIEADGKMYLDSGGGTATNMSEFDVYAFTLADFRMPRGGGSCT